jgi:hypothetical protein
MFKGVSWCISIVCIFDFGQFNPLLLLSLNLSLPTHIIQQLSILSIIFSTCIDVMYFDTVEALPFSFPSYSHRVAPLLQTCFIYKFIHDHVWFCVYVYVLDLSSTYERNHVTFVFLSLAYFT